METSADSGYQGADGTVRTPSSARRGKDAERVAPRRPSRFRKDAVQESHVHNRSTRSRISRICAIPFLGLAWSSGRALTGTSADPVTLGTPGSDCGGSPPVRPLPGDHHHE